ncbi:MAG: copper resistance protein CopC [Ardenticatenaceae bacterium]|nr:copper resistance protein CopC [Ardenticatenaceae bacterium]MCB9445264.1 copper resistance protein CopC [Ardenticatenaceae bacterium]
MKTKNIIFTGILVLTAMASMVTAVFAHDATVIKSEPADGAVLAESPSEVTAWFEEELVSGQSTMSVLNIQGVQVDNGDGGVNLNDPDHASMIVTLPPLSDGVYTVQWHATLLDGDASDGSFTFTIGAGQEAVTSVAPAVATPASSGMSVNVIAAIAAGVLALLLIGRFAIRRR